MCALELWTGKSEVILQIRGHDYGWVPFMATLLVFGMVLFPLNLLFESCLSPRQSVWTSTCNPVTPSYSFANGFIYRKVNTQTQAPKAYNTPLSVLSEKAHERSRKERRDLSSLIDFFFSELQSCWMSFITEVFHRTLTGSDKSLKWLLCMPLCTICLFILGR